MKRQLSPIVGVYVSPLDGLHQGVVGEAYSLIYDHFYVAWDRSAMYNNSDLGMITKALKCDLSS